MRELQKDRIVHVPWTPLLEEAFLLYYYEVDWKSSKRKVFFLKDLLKNYENTSLYSLITKHPACYMNVYSEEDEYTIFETLCKEAIATNTPIHIVGITLQKEIQFLETLYETLGFFDDTIHCFRVDFSIPLITVSVCIEHLMWKGSDYKRMKDRIFFIPPIRSTLQNKALFKGINRWVIASLYMERIWEEEKNFLCTCIQHETILPLTLGKILCYNLQDIGFIWVKKEMILPYSLKSTTMYV